MKMSRCVQCSVDLAHLTMLQAAFDGLRIDRSGPSSSHHHDEPKHEKPPSIQVRYTLRIQLRTCTNESTSSKARLSNVNRHIIGQNLPGKTGMPRLKKLSLTDRRLCGIKGIHTSHHERYVTYTSLCPSISHLSHLRARHDIGQKTSLKLKNLKTAADHTEIGM